MSNRRYTCHVCKKPITTQIKRIGGRNGRLACLWCWKKKGGR